MRKLLLAALALPLASCAALPAMLGVPAAPSEVSQRTTLDERLALGAESAYTFAAELGRLAFRTGIVAPTQSPAALQPDFCQQVTAGRVDTSALDRGGKIMALDCRAYAAVLLIRSAYEAGNAQSYQAAYDRAQPLFAEFLNLVRGR